MAGNVALGGRRRKRKPETNARARLFQIAADQYEDGDSFETFKGKMKAAVKAEPADKPFMAILMKLLELLLPIIFAAFTK